MSRAAFVTGAAGGIGRATALAFAAGGTRVTVADIDLERCLETVALIAAAGGTARAVRLDVSDAGQVEAAIAEAVAAYGRIDYAFNNAAIGTPKPGPVENVEEADWDRVLDINLKGVFLCLKYQVRQMLAQGGGAIVNTASVGGLVGSPLAPAYIASKHGVIGLTRATALDYAQKNIRVNAVCPGYIRTPMMEKFIDGAPGRLEWLNSSLPIGRLGTPDEIAQAVVWLCSDAASYVTGTTLAVDGAFTAV